MITIRNWIATIPEEEKHIAFVGEHQSVTRQFLLTGDQWETYKDWSFHLDMAFDLSTVTKREQRKMEKTQVNNTENVTETQVSNTGTTTKESYTVEEVDVDCSSTTDIASLDKEVREDGILLTWDVLRQHTQLPGKLTATIRALGDAGKVKKSDLMVFEVEPAVIAEPAAEVAQSEFEAMEERMGNLVGEAAASAHYASLQAENAVSALSQMRDLHKDSMEEIEDLTQGVREEMHSAFDVSYGKNLLNPDTVTYGKAMNKNGVTGTVEGYDLSLTDYIPVKEGDVLSYQRTNEETGEREYWFYYMVCLFDDEKNVNVEANNYTASASGSLHTIVIPAGVSYVRLTLHDLPTSVEPAIVNSEELVAYEDYGALYRLKKEGYTAEPIMDLVHPVQYTAQELTESQKAQARQNIGVADAIVVDDVLNENSDNPIKNKSLAKIYNTQIKPFLLPNPAQSQTYHILQARMNGGGFELVPFQDHLYMQNWVLPYLLSLVTPADEGKTMQVVNGKWALTDPIGDISTALDAVIAVQEQTIALQENLIGGDSE